MKKLFSFLFLFILIGCPAIAHASAFGLSAELDLIFNGLSETQWSIIPQTGETSTYAMYGNTYFGPAVGPSFYFIPKQNVYLGLSGLYRQFEGKFQTPSSGTFPHSDFKKEELLFFNETVGLFRLGYIDYYKISKWNFTPFDDVLVAHPFGLVRFGLVYSDISSSEAFSNFEPGTILILGLETGAIFNFAKYFNLTISGIIDYNITVSPYRGASSTERHEILINTLMLSLAFQLGAVSESPE